MFYSILGSTNRKTCRIQPNKFQQRHWYIQKTNRYALPNQSYLFISIYNSSVLSPVTHGQGSQIFQSIETSLFANAWQKLLTLRCKCSTKLCMMSWFFSLEEIKKCVYDLKIRVSLLDGEPCNVITFLLPIFCNARMILS